MIPLHSHKAAVISPVFRGGWVTEQSQITHKRAARVLTQSLCFSYYFMRTINKSDYYYYYYYYWLFPFLTLSQWSPHVADFGGVLSSNSQIFTAPSLNQVNVTQLPVLWFAGPLCSSSFLPLSLLSSLLFLLISSSKYTVLTSHLDYWVHSIPALIKILFIILLQRGDGCYLFSAMNFSTMDPGDWHFQW